MIVLEIALIRNRQAVLVVYVWEMKGLTKSIYPDSGEGHLKMINKLLKASDGW